MAYHCKNCGQPALETDTICWHCGYALTPAQTKPKSATTKEKEEQTTAPLLPIARFAAYAGWTLVIIISLFVLMRSLGAQPQVIQSISGSLKPGWTAVTDQNRVFTLNLPVQWAWFDRYNQAQETEFMTQVRENNQYQAALSPYDKMADDRQLLFLAVASHGDVDTAVPPFVIGARSQQLSQMSPQQITGFLREGPAGIQLLRASLGEGNGRQQTLAILTIPYGDQNLRCQHLFTNSENVNTDSSSFIIVGCASEDVYADYTNIFHNVLVSFQPLLQ